MSEIYPLAKEGVFLTVQGEGVLLGLPMVFVRLAGCSVGCPQCDTDYRVHERVTAREIARRVVGVAGHLADVWLTGGEPTDHDLGPLLTELHEAAGMSVALATAGTRKLTGIERNRVCFLSVSPHDLSKWKLRRGDQLNLVPGLNGLRLQDIDAATLADMEAGFDRRFVTPPWYGPGDRTEGVKACADWVREHPGWRLGVQAHKAWGLP